MSTHGPHRWLDGLAGSFCAAGCGARPGTSDECPLAPTVRAPKRAPVAKPAPTAKPCTEADLCRDIIAALAASGRVLVIRDEKKRIIFPHRNVQRPTPWGTFGLGAGSADVIGMMVGGKLLAIEVKKPDDPEPDDHQARWLAAIRAGGGVAFVAHSAEEAVAGLP